jgi:hypothetical protein
VHTYDEKTCCEKYLCAADRLAVMEDKRRERQRRERDNGERETTARERQQRERKVRFVLASSLYKPDYFELSNSPNFNLLYEF